MSDTEFVCYAVQSPVDITFSTVKNINADQLKQNAGGRSDLISLVTGTVSDASIGKNGQLVMRGSREGASTMYIDGEKVYGGAGLPGGSIQQVTVLSGGIPAAYGDMSGGVVIITTKTFESGFAAKQAMYDEAEASAEAAKKAAAEKSGQLIDKDGHIIEQEKTPVPVPQTPAPANGGGN
ncbi:MAG TPA: TonB-dependent receptor plug domain-containing protein, partial [Bacteroidia bacterium]|nr:TonB-dependent receptor plug domain-containing protein [Bacteroidia bacterium]